MNGLVSTSGLWTWIHTLEAEYRYVMMHHHLNCWNVVLYVLLHWLWAAPSDTDSSWWEKILGDIPLKNVEYHTKLIFIWNIFASYVQSDNYMQYRQW